MQLKVLALLQQHSTWLTKCKTVEGKIRCWMPIAQILSLQLPVLIWLYWLDSKKERILNLGSSSHDLPTVMTAQPLNLSESVSSCVQKG